MGVTLLVLWKEYSEVIQEVQNNITLMQWPAMIFWKQSRRLLRWLLDLFLQAQLDELVATYKKAHKADLADEIDKKCTGDLKTVILSKLVKKGKKYSLL